MLDVWGDREVQLPQEVDGIVVKAMEWPSTWRPGCIEHIAAGDPGETTGITILHRKKAERDTWIFAEIPYAPLRIHNALLHVDLIIVERFTVKSNSTPTANYTALEVVGVIKLAAQLQGIPPPVFAQSTDIQGDGTAINEQWQHEAHLWMPGMIHANDAARHIIHHLIFKEGEAMWLKKHADIMRKRISG